MKIILIKDVAKLGKRYEVKNASDGYAANMLFPRNLAIPATPENLRRIESEKARAEGERKVHEALLAENLKALESVSLEISGKASDKGHLFAALHREAIAEALAKQAHIQIDPLFISLKQPIKETGEHVIEVKSEGKAAKFKLTVKGE